MDTGSLDSKLKSGITLRTACGEGLDLTLRLTLESGALDSYFNRLSLLEIGEYREGGLVVFTNRLKLNIRRSDVFDRVFLFLKN